MERVKSCSFPELSPEFTDLFSDDQDNNLIVVGVIGRSNLPNCNKMACFDLFNCHIALFTDNEVDRKLGRIKFFYETGGKILYVHFETTLDIFIAHDIIASRECDDFISINSELRTKFGQMLLLATQICHIVVMTEPSSTFDASMLSIFKGLKIIREKYLLKFLPKLLKNTSASYLGKEVRLCSPRFLFFFEKLGRPVDDLTAYEIEMEDSIYQMLRSNFIITNNAQLSLFSIAKNKKFLFINTDEKMNSDPIADSLDLLLRYIDEPETDFQYIPYNGYGYGLQQSSDNEKIMNFDDDNKRSFSSLLDQHVEEALQHGFDDSISKYRGKNHFVRPSRKAWFETFKLMHKVFIENSEDLSFQPKDPDYKAFLENFHKLLDIDEQLFGDACNHGYDLALSNYSDTLPHHYSKSYHESKLDVALEVFRKYARGSDSQKLEEKIRENCDAIWKSGKQQCEILSLRGNPCIMVMKHASAGTPHSSGLIFVSACNCGKTLGHREDPYTVRKANFEFYQMMIASCASCEKSTTIDFPIFVPSSTDFKAAEVTNKNLTSLILSEYSNKTPTDDKPSEHQHHLSASQETQEFDSDLSDSSMSKHKKRDGSDEDVNEIVVKVGELDVREEQLQVSTTEYLPGMLLSTSPPGLLPQFPSWSLLCIGSSSIYSHNTGLTENQMPGFLSGTNYLLSWDVKVRLEHAQNWVENYEKNRNRKKQKQTYSQHSSGIFTLKIFVGVEYECSRGHRFMMSSNSTILRGASGGSRTSCGSKVVLSDMPLFFPCPCKSNSVSPSVAQLIRIHIVTPKAPVNINLDPKIKIKRETEMIFTTGWSEPATLSQSAYWVLRLPYVYQGENDPIPSPALFAASEALRYGCLIQGMLGIKENESFD